MLVTNITVALYYHCLKYDKKSLLVYGSFDMVHTIRKTTNIVRHSKIYRNMEKLYVLLYDNVKLVVTFYRFFIFSNFGCE